MMMILILLAMTDDLIRMEAMRMPLVDFHKPSLYVFLSFCPYLIDFLEPPCVRIDIAHHSSTWSGRDAKYWNQEIEETVEKVIDKNCVFWNDISLQVCKPCLKLLHVLNHYPPTDSRSKAKKVDQPMPACETTRSVSPSLAYRILRTWTSKKLSQS